MIKFVLESLENVIEEVSNIHNDRLKAVEELLAETNGGIAPKRDSHGRYHSPHYGYVLPENWALFGEYIPDEKTFDKGQYLPIPLIRDDLVDNYKPLNSKKIKVDESLADEIINELKYSCYVNTSKGKSWKVNDISICYLYISSSDMMIVDKFIKAIKSSIENVDKQVYTGDAVVGRVRVKGEVIKTSIVDHIGYRGEIEFTRKLLIRLDNDSTCYGTQPNGIDINVGDVIEFTASFEESESKHHSFYKRPHNMVKLSQD